MKSTDPPSHFMPPPNEFRHDYWLDKHEKYHWIQSKQLFAYDFFNALRPPPEIYRIVVTTFDGCDPGDYGLKKEGWQEIHGCAVSPELSHSWPELTWTGNGDDLFVFRADVDLELVAERLSDFDDLQFCETLDNNASDKVRHFWSIVDALKPYAYVNDCNYFSAVLADKEQFDLFLASETFLFTEDRMRREFEQRRRGLWSVFAPECGPEKCIEPSCEHLRIKLAVRCAEHQRLWGERPLPEPWTDET